MKIDWEPIRPFLDRYQRFVVSSHQRPDADAIGSALGMAAILDHLGKACWIVNPSAAAPNLAFLDPQKRVRTLGTDITAADLESAEAHIIVDTSAWAQLADVGRWSRQAQKPRLVIDHHVSSDDLSAVMLKDTTAEATGGLIYQLAEFLGVGLSAETATALYTAIATDTGWFRFSATSGTTMRTVGALVDLGARPEVVFRALYEQHSLARMHLAGRALSRITRGVDGQLAYTWLRHSDLAETQAGPNDSEDLVNECLKIAGTKVAFLAIEQPNRQVKFSLRSRTGVNVAAVAELFGGGGHKQAAGATLAPPFERALELMLNRIEDALTTAAEDAASAGELMADAQKNGSAGQS